MVLWIPGHSSKIPKGWRTLLLPGGHFIRTGISYLKEEYFKNWNERGRRARKKFLNSSECRIETVDGDVFSHAFSQTRVRHPFKKEYIAYYKNLYSIDPDSIRSYIAYDQQNTILAGLAVHDSGNMSTHMVAFTAKT